MNAAPMQATASQVHYHIPLPNAAGRQEQTPTAGYAPNQYNQA